MLIIGLSSIRAVSEREQLLLLLIFYSYLRAPFKIQTDEISLGRTGLVVAIIGNTWHISAGVADHPFSPACICAFLEELQIAV